MLPHSSAGPQGSSLRLGDWHPRSTYGITIAWPDCYALLTRETQTNSPRLSLRWEVYNDRYSARYQAPNGTYVDTEDIFTIEDVRAWLVPMEAPGSAVSPQFTELSDECLKILTHAAIRRPIKRQDLNLSRWQADPSFSHRSYEYSGPPGWLTISLGAFAAVL